MNNILILLVRTAGLEPALPYEKQILSLLRLPFRHVRWSIRSSRRAGQGRSRPLIVCAWRKTG